MDDYARSQRRQARHERKRQRLGSAEPTCATCGCKDVQSLTCVPFLKLSPRARALMLERHHLAGRAADNRQVTLCLNCHAVLSDDQYDWPARARRPRTQDERLAAFLQGLADWFRLLGYTLVALAESLQAWVVQLLGE